MGATITNSTVVFLAVLFFIPIVGTFLVSLRTVADISQNGPWSIPTSISLDAYAVALPALLPNFFSSFVTTIPAVLLTCFAGALAAYAISQFRFPGRKVAFLGLIAGGFIPIHVQLIPVFDIINALGIYNTYVGLIIVHTMRNLGISVLILTNFFNAIPRDLRNAARIDGANEMQIFMKIFIPLTRPAFAALSIFLFTWIWNDLLWGLVLTQTDEMKPITAGIVSFQGEYQVEWPLLAAGSLLATLPTIVVFLFFQRHFIKGLTMGSVKG
ncbi:carbohydrate ABC transporter permease [Microbacterium aquimaris]|uniref:carbohydrate ABC transporter permease n=1 Tax=Microbacterium aquimaris TaxID=459816 RepID=UPI002AD4C63E|nr:carbohydrate ABC transporter permease [Microbacterium aquimaris]MDZ8275269.1 carbohydrate ABC transporter permease [Microbacterium aquimaris]